MATIKSYTSQEQSKKLAEILPIESADMCFNTHNNMPPLMTPYSRFKEFFNMEPTPAFLIPCWSLAALLDILPNGVVMNKDSQSGRYHFSFKYIETYFTADNPVDACYELILMLHELKLL